MPIKIYIQPASGGPPISRTFATPISAVQLFSLPLVNAPPNSALQARDGSNMIYGGNTNVPDGEYDLIFGNIGE